MVAKLIGVVLIIFASMIALGPVGLGFALSTFGVVLFLILCGIGLLLVVFG